MTQQEHLLLIRAKCVELLELAKQRTPGRWLSHIDDTGGETTGWPLSIESESHQDKCIVRTGGHWPYSWDATMSRSEAVSNAAFIASAAGPFEASLASTVAAIDELILALEVRGFTYAEQELVDSIRESWPLELLK